MAIGLQELLKTSGGESSALVTLKMAADDGNIHKAARGGFTQEVVDWYNQRTAGKSLEDLAKADIRQGQSLSVPNFTSAEQNRNETGLAEYNQRLQAIKSNAPGVPALGTTAYTNYLLGGQYFTEGQGGTGQLKPFVPTTSIGTTNLPTPNYSTGSITEATAGTAGISASLDARMQELDRQRQEAAKSQEESRSWLQNFLSSTPTREEVRSDFEAQTGMKSAEFFADQKAKIAEIETLTKEYNNVVAARDTQIAQSYDKLASMNFINNRIAQINRNAAPELSRLSANINSKAAVLEALQGNFDRAQNYINQAVQDATADTKFRLDAFSMIYQINQDSLKRLDTQYQDAMDKAYDMAKFQYQNDLKMKETLGQLQVDNPQVSINLNGTLEQAVTAIKARPQPGKGDIFGSADTGYLERYYDPASNSYKTRSIGGGGGGGNGYKFTSTQYNSGAASAGLDLGTFKMLPGDVQNFFISSPQKTIDNMNSLIKNIEAGIQTKDEAKSAIDSTGGLNPNVAGYLKGVVDLTSTPEEKKSWWSNLWGAITGK